MQWLPILNWTPPWPKVQPTQKSSWSMTSDRREAILTRLFQDTSVRHYTALISLEATLINKDSFNTCLVQHVLPNPPLPSVTHLLVPAISLPNCVILSRISSPRHTTPLLSPAALPYHLQAYGVDEPLASRVLFPLGDSPSKETVTVSFLPDNRTVISMSDLIGASSDQRSTLYLFYQGPSEQQSSSEYYLPSDFKNPVAMVMTTYSEICQYCSSRGFFECVCHHSGPGQIRKSPSTELEAFIPFNPFESVARQDWPSAATHLAAHSFDTIRFSHTLTTDPSTHFAQEQWVSEGSLNYRYQVGPGSSPELEREFQRRYLPQRPATDVPDLAHDPLSSLLNDPNVQMLTSQPEHHHEVSSTIGATTNPNQAGPLTLQPQLPPVDTSYRCPECGDLFRGVDKLEVHFGVKHPKAKLVKCDRCHKSFRNRSNRDKHKKIVHLKLMKYPCPVCKDVSFGQRWDLSRHMNSHHGGMPIPETESDKARKSRKKDESKASESSKKD